VATNSRSLNAEAELEEAKRFMASKEFKDLSAQSQYAYFVQHAANPADSASKDTARLSVFQDIMEGFLETSSWSISGSQYSLADVTSVSQPITKGISDNILAATYQPDKSSRLYIAATGLNNVD